MRAHHRQQYGSIEVAAIVTAPPWYENCYILKDIAGGDCVVVDPGGRAPAILAVLGDDAAKVKAIWLTHSHPDHISAVRGLQEALGIPCLVHSNEQPIMERVVEYARHTLGTEVEAPLSVELFGDDAALALGGQAVTVLPAPGHTPGGVVYWMPGFALTGDTLFQQGIGRTDLPGGNGRTLAASIDRLLETVPAGTVLYSGHGPHWSADEAVPWWHGMRSWAGLA